MSVRYDYRKSRGLMPPMAQMRTDDDDDDERILAAWASQAGVYTCSVV